ncbi:MAG: hypothetical protein CXT73_00100 [Methanobacteriota archaeon]|jgi:hypothetical protein|nr:MAG: hypothetical protein CXT73_00100 [Euryarchaeota archaeon]
MSKILIVVGPQGSGNHVWAKIFGLHPAVYGWEKLQSQYWEAHHYEPFAKAWDDPSTLQFPKSHTHYVTSCSIPYVHKGGHRIPPILEFCGEVEKHNVEPVIVVLSRDKDILKSQQKRVRGQVTINDTYEIIEQLNKHYRLHFLSYECLHLWGKQYLKDVSINLSWPIHWSSPKIDEILKINTNLKYINDIVPQELDKVVSATYKDYKV